MLLFDVCKSYIHLNNYCHKNSEKIEISLYLCTIMDAQLHLKLEEKIIDTLKTVYDPEIPVDIYSLGLIYKIDLDDNGDLTIDMTLTAPNCPAADFLIEDTRIKLEAIEGIKSVTINLVFEPEWTQDMMTEEAKLELGFL